MKKIQKERTECRSMRDGKCLALYETDCENCSFYATKSAIEAADEKAYRRIERLDKKSKQHIYRKYYKGV